MLREHDLKDKEWVESLRLFSAVLADLLGYVGAGVGLGYLAWKKLGAPIWVSVVLALVGLTAAMIQLYRRARS